MEHLFRTQGLLPLRRACRHLPRRAFAFALRQLIVAISGSFDVTVDDGARRKTITLTALPRPVCRHRIWRTIDNFHREPSAWYFASRTVRQIRTTCATTDDSWN